MHILRQSQKLWGWAWWSVFYKPSRWFRHPFMFENHQLKPTVCNPVTLATAHLLPVFKPSVLPDGSSGKRTCLQCRRCGFDRWMGKITLEKEMATHSSILAWKVPWTEESGGLQSMRLQRAEHRWMIKHTEMNIKYKYNIYLHIYFPPNHHDVIKQ